MGYSKKTFAVSKRYLLQNSNINGVKGWYQAARKPIHFEQVRISNEDSIHQEPLTSQSIIIQFPNQSSCEVKMDIKSRDFSFLLNQLRLLC
ncbi:hypothetical protein Lwal_0041 [Legionella waltersii]|uniref:Uncharacterized protein n=1 Tax=Legionella waltersii TaxID=66969 RepID=A0A0W1APA5_9GAMM|nr:hypothetical protein Lwal_0041 [Legionella waltersii]SNU96840.1 Uncharacterised protein [Legionella waltersii]